MRTHGRIDHCVALALAPRRHHGIDARARQVLQVLPAAVDHVSTPRQRGFRIAIVPGGSLHAAAHTLQGCCSSLLAHGSTLPWLHRVLGFDGLNAVIGRPEGLADGQRHNDGSLRLSFALPRATP